MKNKINYLVVFVLILITTNLSANTSVYIYTTVDNEIITNYDIDKEKAYLKILNPSLKNLNEGKIFNIAKNTLVNEKIKKNELIRYYDLRKDLPLVDQVLANLYKRLNFEKEDDFRKILSVKKNYSIQEIKEKLKIEIFWNELIFTKYKNQIKIDEKKLIKKIKNNQNELNNEFLLSEIFFNKKKGENLDKKIIKIQESIKKVGFNNTANIYSISESANFGGKIGWIPKNNLSKLILNALKEIEVGEFTNVVQVGNNFLILKLEEKRTKKIKINIDQQLKEMISFERNNQLEKFSNIYFNKLKINYSIDDK